MHELKPFTAIQRVRLPPGKGAARQPEPSLTWRAVTGVVKRRQGVMKRRGKPRDQQTMTPSVLTSWGQHRKRHDRRGATGRPGSWTDAESREGSPGNLGGPVIARRGTTGYGENRNKAPGSTAGLHGVGSAGERTRSGKQPVDPADEPISRRAGMAGSRSALIVPKKAGNRGQRDPLEGSEASPGQSH